MDKDVRRPSQCELLGRNEPADSSARESLQADEGTSPKKEYFCGIGKLRPKWLQVRTVCI